MGTGVLARTQTTEEAACAPAFGGPFALGFAALLASALAAGQNCPDNPGARTMCQQIGRVPRGLDPETRESADLVSPLRAARRAARNQHHYRERRPLAY